MSVADGQAWITSAVYDKDVDKAMTLAESLKLVRTARKLVIITTSAVSIDLRKRLKEIFDLVLVLLEQDCPEGWALDDYAKFTGFSLRLFKKGVYVSPNSLVVRNCDDIFDGYTGFAARHLENSIDSSVCVFATGDDVSVKSLRFVSEDFKNDFPKSFEGWLKNNVRNIENLDGQHNVRIHFNGYTHDGLITGASIVNFIELHPLDIPKEMVAKAVQQVGLLEKFATQLCWKLYSKAVVRSSLQSTRISLTSKYETEPIAIVGMSFRLPGGNDVDEFWSLLKEGKNAVVPLPPHRMTKNHSYYHCYNRKIEAGFLNTPLDEFDCKFFGLSPKEAEYLDPQQRLLLEVTWEAFEDAMLDPIKLKGTQTGVFVGSWVQDYKDMLCLRADFDFFRTYMGNSIGTTSARLSHFLESTGPSIATESGCSSTISAIDMACKSLRNGTSSLAVAGGVNLLLRPFEPNFIESVLSPDYRCKTFDASANGFVRAEGIGVLLLKRLSDATKDGDNIWGLIRGTALTQEGVSKSMGTPTVHCESLAMEHALKEAGVNPKDVSYVEAHGTGTVVGDPMEIAAIKKVYSRGRKEPLLIGSVKTNIGHTEAVSGMAGIIKVLLAMKHELIPKHLNLNTLNPNIILEEIPACIPFTAIPWRKTQNQRRIAGVSSFGITGTDGHAVVEEPPEKFLNQLQFEQERPRHIMKISAKSTESLDILVQKYLTIFEDRIYRSEDSALDFANIAYSANIGRVTFNVRAVFTANNFTEAASILKDKSFTKSDVQLKDGNLCFLFTGQGSQYPNMARQLYDASPIFKDNFEKCAYFLQERYRLSIKNILWSDSEEGELSRTLYSQTSIFVVEYCLLKLWESWGIKPDYVLGHSLGEYTAAVAAGVLDFEDALMLVFERSRLIDQLPSGKMLVIKENMKTVDEKISEFQKMQPEFCIDFAAHNSPEQTVIAGKSEMIEDFAKFCVEKSIKATILAATHAFHSRQMDPILDAYRVVAKTVKKPRFEKGFPKYISGMEGKLVDLELIDAEYWVRHTRERVRYVDACRVVQSEGCTLFLEVGPHPVLSALTMINFDSQPVACLPSIRRKMDEWVTILDSLSKLYLSNWKGEIDWKGFDRFYARERVSLPFYPFNRKPVWVKMDSEPVRVHPLIGSVMPTALNETIFQNSMTLKNARFVQDHVIGNSAIFPGAGFLEMCLAGGHAAVQGRTDDLMKPRKPVSLKSLIIATPLALFESSVYKVQTIAALNEKPDIDEKLGYVVGVHGFQGSNDGVGKWIQHASAKFFPMAAAPSKHTLEPIDIKAIQSQSTKTNLNSLYNKLSEVGLRLGPQFQSLECGWKCAECTLTSVKIPKDSKSYLIHPITADAMIQALMLWTSKEKMKTKLHVPVQIGEFMWLKDVKSRTQFVYCSNDENNVPYCILVDNTGSALAYMKEVIFIETTVKLVEGMIAQQSTAMPQLWEEVWKPNRGPKQGYLTHKTSVTDLDFSEDELKIFLESNRLKDKLKFHAKLAKLVRFSILKALYILGWKPIKDSIFSVKLLTEELCIREQFYQYLQFFLRSMEKSDFQLLESVNVEESTFKFAVHPPTMAELDEQIKGVAELCDPKSEDFLIVLELDHCLSKILTGEVIPLNILYPEDPIKPSAKKYYEAGRKQQTSLPDQIKIKKHMTNALYSAATGDHRRTYRVLEIGAGTGVGSNEYLKYLTEVAGKDSDIEYYFTDVSPAFFISAEKELGENVRYVVFKKFDMENDPLNQGLCPEYFDMIAAIEVIHIAKDIKKTLKNIRSLLKPGGLVLIHETVHPDENITFIFGLLEGYWQFEDKQFRKYHTTLTPKMWQETMTETGFQGISIVPMCNNIHGVITAHATPTENTFLKNLRPSTHSWIIFSEEDDELSRPLCQKLLNVNRKCFLVPAPSKAEFTEAAMQSYMLRALTSAIETGTDIEGVIYLWSLSPSTRDQTFISLPFLTLMKLISELKTLPKSFAVTKGAFAIPSSTVVDPTPGTLTGICRCVANENSNMTVTCLDLNPNKKPIDQLEELFMNLWVAHTQCTAFRDGLRLSPKLIAGKVARYEPLLLPSGCDRFQLVLPKTNLISDLEFTYLEDYAVGENEVEVEVKATALNFRDVFAVLKPIQVFENINSIGLDFAGVVVKVGGSTTKVKVGDRVIGMLMDNNLSLPSHYKCKENRIIRLPDTLTFTEGVTLPAVFSTALYCLINIAKVREGETVLIHTASGGVGLVAIQICKHIGAYVIATAGSSRKRNYLKRLGIQHVFNSRCTRYKEEILNVTKGFGVHIVLNSITGPGFKEASLDVLCQDGRFIEMSKINIWKKDEVKKLRPDVSYEIVDLTSLDIDEFINLGSSLENMLNSGIIKPIPYERFDALNIRGALSYLQRAHHIGKIVCIMPEVKLGRSMLVATTPLFNDHSTYVVTGGMGGIGFEIIKWMLNNGAKHIAILNRSNPSPEVTSHIEMWNKAEKHIHAFPVDVGNYEMMKMFFENLKNPELGFPHVRGVMHAAGVLNDALLENQSWDKFTQTYNPKVNGTWNLHDLTKDYLLEHFVLFSSVAATLGNPGQANHCASNSFEDSFAAYRRSNGLPATCVNWGNWGEVGIATEFDSPGFRPITTSQGLLALETFLKTQTNSMCVLNVDSFSLMVKLFPQLKHYLDDCRLLGDDKESQIINFDDFWDEVDSEVNRVGRINVFKKLIKTVVRKILKMDKDEAIQDQSEFQTLGIDSLMMLEMKNGLQNVLRRRITFSASRLRDCSNTEVLASTLVDILEGHGDSQENEHERKQLIRDDANLLSDALLKNNLKRNSIEQIETVLLTGSTGNLGPYLLVDLIARDQVKKVFCLIRKSKTQSGLERLRVRLEHFTAPDADINMKKIEVVEGDITSPKFGLDDNSYYNICEQVDAVIHSAVRSDHTARYWKAPESNKSHIRNVNVLGTVRLLEFAAEKKLKHFFHASTMLAFTGIGTDGQFSDGWQDVSAYDDIQLGTMGYAISKHIGEQLVYRALMKGMPCKAFRFPVISGDSETGRIHNYQQNHAILRWLTCMKIGAIHDIPVPLMAIPVDHCAKISLEIFFNSDAPMDVYNIVQKSMDVEQVLVEVAKSLGIELEIVPHTQFMEKLKSEGAGSPIVAFAQLYENEESGVPSSVATQSVLALRKFFEDGRNFLLPSKLIKYAPNYDTLMKSTSDALKRDLVYLKSKGVFAKYGIKTYDLY